ncbi:MAG: hypothetical protein IJ306_00980 [Oscillospiraceae bacterium]|nr:hypothetical protein [Oscillospiraceae bacterium]
MDMFTGYLEERIAALKAEAAELEKNYRQDDAVFVKIRINVYDVCKTVFGVFKKMKSDESLCGEYLKKLDEFEKTWSASLEKAKEFGDSKKAAAEEAKLSALADVRGKFVEVFAK